jgi:RHS repeat-associated protein
MVGSRPGLFAAILALATLLTPTFGDAQIVGHASTDTDLSILGAIRTAHFEEPLIPTSATSSEENRVLAVAVSAHEKRPRVDDFAALTDFLAKYPQSGWAPALRTNLGLSYLHYGYFSKALEAWELAWQGGKSATEPQAKALVDRAIGQLIQLEAALGHFDRVAALLKDIGRRPISGSATEAVQVASEQLLQVGKDPHHYFNCGPLALQSLMRARGADESTITFLQWMDVGPNGMSLAELDQLASKAKFSHALIFRKPGQKVPVPSIVHWKVGHFAAIVGEANGRYRVEDPISRGRGLWVTPAALENEASGYFLLPSDRAAGSTWQSVTSAQATNIRGKGNTTSSIAGDRGDPTAKGTPDPSEPGDTNSPDSPANNPNGVDNKPPGGCAGGMCGYDIKEASVSVTLSDTPVGYRPPIGPSAKVRITYNQREDSQPANFTFFNVSQKWTLNWLSYVTDDPANPGASVTRYLSGGGSISYSGYNSTTGRFTAQDTDGSTLVRTSGSPITYQRQLSDGGIEIYSQSDGSGSYPRRIFLTQMIDPQGNALSLSYDGQLRLTTVTDAVGRQTTLSYGLAVWPLLVTQISDPFGRSATLSYDGLGRLNSITDVIGITSSFTYDANSLVNSLTTPYGTTNFSYTAPGTSAPPRFVQVADPMGFHEREEWLEPSPNPPTPASDPAATVPTGMPYTLTNNYLQYRNSFHWDKNAYGAASCTPTGGCDYTKARIRHFTHVPPSTTIKNTSLESVKMPLENRIWYAYPGQSGNLYGGTSYRPSAVGRVLDDGTSQVRQFSYDTAGYFKLTQMIDPLGRTTNYIYSNQIDLIAITQLTARGFVTPIAQYTYNYHHRPVAYTDAAGQTTNFAYNSTGQVTSITNALGQKTSFAYDGSHNLSTVTNANNATAATYTYDGFARVRTFTDSEGWIVTYDYDAADRVTRITYPDGTTDLYTYSNLDLVSHTDRQVRTWTYAYDANRRLTSVTDPAGALTQFGYNNAGKLVSLTDPKTNVTQWTYDIEGRLIGKQYADTSTLTYTYETTTSRLKSITDALSQVRTYGYAKDDRLTAITYTGAVHTTPNVSFTYDPYFPRVASMTDGTGTTQYAYVPAGTLGALQLSSEASPLAASTVSYLYDELGRLSSRTVQGAGAETFSYDAIGRLVGHAHDMGSFTLGYLGQTGQITSRALASSTLATTWSYLTNTNDRRLSGINNTGLTAGQFSNYGFTTTPENFISAITESSDVATVYPAAASQTATYNTLNQLTNLSGQAITFDAVGNVTSDGQRGYTWDAENRLLGITYPGVSGKATAFTYDGLGRRVTIASTPPGGGSATTSSYLWCGAVICQARNGSNTTIRSYYREGELVPGTPNQPFYYGIDQIGSVRRAFASTSSAPAYSYDPYGVPLQITAPVTDFVFAGMFYNADSGLLLTKFRVYDPLVGRWLSRDRFGESADPTANLYPYVSGNPASFVDPLGTNPLAGAIAGAGIGTAILPGIGTAVGIVVGTGVAIWVGIKVGDLIISKNEKTPPVPPPTVPPGWKGDTPPAPGWVWKGPDAPGGKRGGWVSPDGEQSLHPDFNHEPGIEPHTDWNDPYGGRWRIYPDGRCEPK